MNFIEKLSKALDVIRESVLETEGIPSPADVIEIIARSGMNYSVIGAHGIYKHTKKLRATVDVDIVVSDPQKAATLIINRWPHLEMVNFEVKITFKHGGHDVIDLIKPGQAVFDLALQNSIEGIPSLEMALVLKFASMISHNRKPEDKMQDAADFGTMVLKNKNSISIQKISNLINKADLYPGSEVEITNLISDITQGKQIKI